MGYAPILEINKFRADEFINRGGKIPAPMRSLTNWWDMKKRKSEISDFLFLCGKGSGDAKSSVEKVDGAFGPEGYGRLMAAGCTEGGNGPSGRGWWWPLRGSFWKRGRAYRRRLGPPGAAGCVEGLCSLALKGQD
jgi:hypothetical protein